MFFLVASDRFADHLTPPGHPDRPSRAHVMDAVAVLAAARGATARAPRPATLDELLRVHAAEYVQRLDVGRPTRLDPDTFTSPDTAAVARLAAGAVVTAVDCVLEVSQPGARHEPPPAGLVMVRPPGHHAQRTRATGFCIYNNVAVGAAHALARGLDRVAIVDYDVHHGNGTERLFYDEPRVLFVSTHQYPFYPGTGTAADVGAGAGEGFTVNVPIEAGATDGDYATVFDRLVVPVVEAYRPQMLLVSAGFDAHMRDPTARMRLSVDGLRHLAAALRGTAARLSVPIVFVTEGGYHLRALGACLDDLVGLLAHDGLPPRGASGRAVGAADDPLTADDAALTEDAPLQPTHRGPDSVKLVQAAQQRYWPTL